MLPLPELKASVDASTQQKLAMMERLEKLQSGDVRPVSVGDREKVNRDRKKWEKIASARKKIRQNMWQQIESQIEKGQAAELKETLDLSF